MNRQPSLFDDPPAPVPAGDTHPQSLERVRHRIGATILAFLRERLSRGEPEFTIADLHAYVTTAHGVAPASPDRILRDGRQRGLYAYELLSRRQSRYRVTRVEPVAEVPAEGTV